MGDNNSLGVSLFVVIAVLVVTYLINYKANSILGFLDYNIKIRGKKFFKNFKIFFNTLNNLKRKVFSFLIGWSIINMIFFVRTTKETVANYDLFWPIDRDSTLKYDYGFLELTIYTIIPWLIFYFYHFMNKPSKNK